jgi:DNA polymerase III delta subunit
VAQIKNLWLTSDERQFQALEPDDWGDAQGQKLALLAGQASLFEPAPLYHLRRAERVDKWWQHFSPLARAARREADEPVFCLSILKEKLPPAALKLLKAFPEAFAVVTCFPPLRHELSLYISHLLAAHSLALSPGAQQLLLDTIGDDAINLANEVSKLSLLFPEPSTAPLSAETLAPYLGLLRENQAFQLSSHLLAGRFGEAHLLCQELLLRRESAIALVGIIARHCRISLQVALATQRALPLSEQARLFRLPLQTLRDYSQQRRKPTKATLYRSLAACQQADMILKSRPQSEDLLLAGLIDGLSA